MPPRKRSDSSLGADDPAYDGVPTVVVHIEADPEPEPDPEPPAAPVVAVDVPAADGDPPADGQ